MGSGKSCVSNKLASMLNRELVSTDSRIQEKEGKSIADIFFDKGENYFRNVEEEVVKEVAQKENIVLDCGGGAVLNPNNLARLKQNGFLIYLKASTDVLFDRIHGKKHRPLMNVANPREVIEDLMKIREPMYNQADVTINTDQQTIQEVCDEIQRKLNND